MLLDFLPENAFCPRVLLAACVVFLSLFLYWHRNRGLPPGPWGLPYIGIWPFLKEDDDGGIHLQIDAMRKRYGSLFSFTVTGRLYINLTSSKIAREALVTKADCFDAKVEDYSLLTYVFKEGVTFANGDKWQVQRKLFLSYIKEAGLLSSNSSSQTMQDAMANAVIHLKKTKGEPVKIIDVLSLRFNDVLRKVMFEEDNVTQQQVATIKEEYAQVIAGITSPNLLLVGNIARYFVIPFLKGYGKTMKSHKAIEKALFAIIEEHKATYKEDHVRGFIDCFIKERNERRSKGDPSVEVMTDRALMASLYQFVGDETLTVAHVAGVFVNYMPQLPLEQEKIFQEVSQVVGTDRLPTLEDKSHMPYTNAVILELLRMFDCSPFLPSMECTKETTIRGYRIPKGSILLINVWTVHNDPEMYEEPSKFKPERFMPKEGSVRPDLPITFGIGKRACLAEKFVMSQLFLFLVGIVQNFQLTFTQAKEPMTMQEFVAKDVSLCATPRAHLSSS